MGVSQFGTFGSESRYSVIGDNDHVVSTVENMHAFVNEQQLRATVVIRAWRRLTAEQSISFVNEVTVTK